jgi:aldehyde oxidoreductase
MSECYSFVVNGVPCSTEEEKPLLRYLRDELRLTSVKDGCSEGACGTCTILVDGKAVKACVLSTKRAAGKEIVTVEGLSEAEREAFVYAFGAVGAVQCGFCIPGMVMAGKALLDQNPNPSEAEIKKAIRGNVCRCTGYKKIIEGIALAGAILRGEASVDPALEEGEDYGVGARAFRTDVRDKVLGRGEYCDDLYLDGMAHASAVRSQYPRARVLDIDPSAAGRPHRRRRAPQQGGPPPAGLGRDDRQGGHHPLRGGRHLPGGGGK